MEKKKLLNLYTLPVKIQIGMITTEYTANLKRDPKESKDN